MIPKIVYLLPELKLGGTERHVLRLAFGLINRGHDAGIVCLFREGALAPEAAALRIPFECLNLPYRWDARTFWRLCRWMRARKPRILHTELFGFHFFAGLAAKLCRVPLVISGRRELADWQKWRHVQLEKLGNRFVDRVVCCSEAVRRRTLDRESLAPAKAVTLYNGIEVADFVDAGRRDAVRRELGIPSQARVVGTVANFGREKGYPHLLEAASRILEKDPSVWFLLVGDGPLLEEMRKRAARIPLGRQILFTGFRSDIPELMAAMDLFALASVSEGFPNVLLEAMAAGKPIVATDVGGIPELIGADRDGLLVPPADAAALAEAVRKLLLDPARAGRLAENAKRTVLGRFTRESTVEQYEKLYLTLMGADHAPRALNLSGVA
ncbi:MAG: glycosyltransferase [Candidatus Omnitrophica bacterium]|nr:glycosyltransferase [Candidatus Omnitrophota bacterium]